MAFDPNQQLKKQARQKIWCEQCQDIGYVIGTKIVLGDTDSKIEWKEVCPYCMPTNKYGNLTARKLLPAPAVLDKTIRQKIDTCLKNYTDKNDGESNVLGTEHS